MDPRATIGRNLDTCRHGPPLIKLMGYEHLEDAMGGEGSRQWQTHKHTHTQTVSPVIYRVVEPRAMIRSNHDTCRRGPPLIKLMGYKHREDAVGGGGNRQWQTHTNTHTYTHTHSVPSNLQGVWSVGQRSEAILTHVSVAPH